MVVEFVFNYYMYMAMQKRNGRNAKDSKKLPVSAIFWMLFVVFISLLFVFNIPKIKKTMENTRFLDRVFNRPAESTEGGSAPDDGALPEGSVAFPTVGFPPLENGGVPGGGGGALPFDPDYPFGTDNPADLQRVQEGGGTEPRSTGAYGVETSAAENGGGGGTDAVVMRERTLYFVTVDGVGMVFLSPVKRSLPGTTSPLVEVINSLMAGPDEKETAAGLKSLIPPDAQLLNARVQGNTAYLNFNEKFQFNSLDAEGYYAQLRQIVWTATEFPNVRNVQILIDNRKMEYLGLTIKIDKPLGRESL